MSALSLLVLYPLLQVGGETTVHHRISGIQPNEELGHFVAGLGDLNGDGFAEIGGCSRDGAFVYSGADGSLLYSLPGRWGINRCADLDGDSVDEICASDGGMVGVYSGADGGLLFQIAGNQGAFANIQDLDGDQIPDLISGDMWHSPPGEDYLGRVMAFSGATGSLLWEVEGFDDWSYFGCDLAIVDDMDSDGFEDIAVSAPYIDETAHGWIYFHSGMDGTLISSFRGERRENFGQSIDSMPDLNGDGKRELIVGAPGGSGGADGWVRIYSPADMNLIMEIKGGGWGGYCVANVGDTNGDGWPDFAYGEPRVGINSGRISICSGLDGHRIWEIRGGSRGMIGHAVAGVDDLDGDGLNEVAGGAPFSQHHGGFDTYGMITVAGFNPWISADINQLSLSQPTHWSFYLNFPFDAAGMDYTLLASFSGTGPVRRGISIPLSDDHILRRTAQSNFPGAAEGSWHGTLDANGMAQVSARVLSGSNWNFAAGHTLYFAAVASPGNRIPQYSTAAIPIKITL